MLRGETPTPEPDQLPGSKTMKGKVTIMNVKKMIAVIVASAAAVTTFAASAAAYDLNKDLKIGWSASVTIPGEEFEGTTPDTVFTITFDADASLAEKAGHEYWCIKPMINDTGWPFIDTLVGPTLSDGKDSYVIQPEDTEIKFTIPAEELEHIQVAGMAIMGHGIKLNTFSYSNDETVAPAAEAAPAPAAEEAAAPAPAAEETAAAPANTETNPRTGVEDVAVMGTLMLISGAAAVASRKRK